MEQLLYDWGRDKTPPSIEPKQTKTRLVFDLESNGYLDTMNKIHCIVMENFDTGDLEWYVRPGFPWAKAHGTLEDGVKKLEKADELIGHNIISFDLQAIKKIFPWFKPKGEVLDTLCMTRVIWADIENEDFKLHKRGQISGNNIGKHNLESWGQRLKIYKGDFGKTTENWEDFTPEMLEYCKQDVRVNSALYHKIQLKMYPKSVLRMEQDIHTICLDQERFGFPFNEKKAAALLAKLLARKAELYSSLYKQLGPFWIVGVADTKSKRTVKYKDPLRGNEYEGSEYTKIKIVEFNPNSRAHLTKRLMEVFKWEPTEFGDDGIPNLDDEILAKIKLPIAKEIAEFLMLQKRLGQLAEGKQAWLSLVKDGKLHGRVNTMGAITARCSHSNPNLAQIPSNDSPYGHECRELFEVEKGEYLLGCDVSGLELRMLAHYMARYDNGAYGEIILNGDIHTANQLAAGLPTRNNAKTFIYGFLYGAGDAKIAEIINGTAKQGKALKEKFLQNTPALKQLRQDLMDKVSHTGTIRALDGRMLPVRHKHAALNTLLQSAGAIVCKMWVIRFHEIMREKGYVHGVHYKQAAFVHDELQVRCCEKTFPRETYVDAKGKTKHKSLVGEIAVQAIRDVGVKLGVRIPLDGEYGTGASYAETH